MLPEHSLDRLLAEHSKLFIEFAVAEPLRRHPEIELHPTLFNTPLIYGSDREQELLGAIYEDYLQTASAAGMPLLLTAPTWRLDAQRVGAAGVPTAINADAVGFLQSVVARQPEAAQSEVVVGALIGPKGDCYRPDLAPEAEAAADFHAPQIAELSATGAGFLLVQTLPSVGEGIGLARALVAASTKPYMISFCVGTDGNVLDGTPLEQAMARIDDDPVLSRPPLGYFVNCTYPSFLTDRYAEGQLDRLIGIQANGSSRDVTALDGEISTVADPLEIWAAEMLRLQETHGVNILGGCCGTSVEHMRALLVG